MGEGARQDFEAELLDCLVDDTESTDLVVEMLAAEGITADADAIEQGLRSLEHRGLVSATRGMHPRRPGEDTWWRLTEAGWLLLAKSDRYGEPWYPPLSSDDPPLRLAIAWFLHDRPSTITELVDALLALGGRLPPDTARVWPHFVQRDDQSADAHRSYVHGYAEHALGKLALDRVVTADQPGDPHLRWRLTRHGADELVAQIGDARR